MTLDAIIFAILVGQFSNVVTTWTKRIFVVGGVAIHAYACVLSHERSLALCSAIINYS